MTAPRAVLFDAGGTLVHMDPQAVGDVLEPVAGSRPDPDRMVAAHYRAMAALNAAISGRHLEGRDLWREWLAGFLEDTGVPPTDAAVEALANARLIWTRPVPGAVAAVAAVRAAGCRVAVVSNADGDVREVLELAGFGGAFEFVLDSAVEGVAKPDPEIFRRALDRLDVVPAAAWYVGDSPYHDVGGAAAAGLAATVLVDPLGLTPGHHPRVCSVVEVPRLLQGAGR